MLRIDGEFYKKQDVERRADAMRPALRPYIPEDGGRGFGALCLRHPIDLLAAIRLLRGIGVSALLLNGETPYAAAREYALKAGCSFLVHGDGKAVYGLPGNVQPPEQSIAQYSSGTTGEPKLVWRTWTEIEQEIAAYNRALPLSSEETPLILVPVAHSFGLISGVLSAEKRDAHPWIVTDRNPRYIAHIIRRSGKSIVYGVPFLFHLLGSLRRDPVRFHKLISSGSPLSVSLLQDLRSRSEEVWQQYGTSETGCVAFCADLSSPSCMGRPLEHVEIALLEADLPAVEPGVRLGEIVIDAFGRRAYTKDAGSFAADGSLHVHGRLDDLINVSGLKVLPSEVEAVLAELPEIAESVVYRIRHSLWGEAVKALVVPTASITPEQIRVYCITRLPPHKVPAHIELTERIPRTPAGKISRKFLEVMEESR